LYEQFYGKFSGTRIAFLTSTTSKTIKFRKVIALFTNAKSKAKRIQGLYKYTYVSCSNIMEKDKRLWSLEKEQYCEDSKGSAHMYMLQVEFDFRSKWFNLGWSVISLSLVFIIIKRDKEITNQPRSKSFWPEIKLTCNKSDKSRSNRSTEAVS